jgi:hypothetical protein
LKQLLDTLANESLPTVEALFSFFEEQYSSIFSSSSLVKHSSMKTHGSVIFEYERGLLEIADIITFYHNQDSFDSHNY